MWFPFLLQIPFSKFYLSHKGIVQDKQAPVETSEIGFFCINLMDNVDGPFHLEIDYIALLNDQNHKEEHAYERYSLEDHVVNVYWRPQIHCVGSLLIIYQWGCLFQWHKLVIKCQSYCFYLLTSAVWNMDIFVIYICNPQSVAEFTFHNQIACILHVLHIMYSVKPLLMTNNKNLSK